MEHENARFAKVIGGGNLELDAAKSKVVDKGNEQTIGPMLGLIFTAIGTRVGVSYIALYRTSNEKLPKNRLRLKSVNAFLNETVDQNGQSTIIGKYTDS